MNATRGWLRTVTRGWRRWRNPPAPTAPVLAERLREYPPYLVPFAGAPGALGETERAANLRHLLAVRAHRTQVLARLLEAWGIDLPRGLHAPDPAPVLASLERWARQAWPPLALADTSLADPVAWDASALDAGDRARSMLMDVAIVLGGVLTAHRRDAYWGLAEPGHGDEGRIVLVARGPVSSPTLLDVQAACLERFAAAGRPGVPRRTMGGIVLGCLKGAA